MESCGAGALGSGQTRDSSVQVSLVPVVSGTLTESAILTPLPSFYPGLRKRRLNWSV
jgi:hypothetical protein